MSPDMQWPAIIKADLAGSGAPNLVMARARLEPTVEILCTAESNAETDVMMEELEALLLEGDGARVTHRPGGIRFGNGSRIIVRVPQRDGRGVSGLHPSMIWWWGRHDPPLELEEMLRRMPPAIGSVEPIWRDDTEGVLVSFVADSVGREEAKFLVDPVAMQEENGLVRFVRGGREVLAFPLSGLLFAYRAARPTERVMVA